MASNSKSLFIISGIIGAVSVVLFAYLMWFVSPEEITEQVTVIAVSDAGCIAETSSGFSVNIGRCDAQSGDKIIGTYDAKVNERLSAIIP